MFKNTNKKGLKHIKQYMCDTGKYWTREETSPKYYAFFQRHNVLGDKFESFTRSIKTNKKSIKQIHNEFLKQ
jgi:hypothetical protein